MRGRITQTPRTPEFRQLVDRIRMGDEIALQELYALFSGGVRFFLRRQVGLQDLDDKVHDVFVIVVSAIRRGELRQPERLMGFVRTVIRRQVAGFIGAAIQERNEQVDLELGLSVPDGGMGPEQGIIEREEIEVMKRLLRDLPDRDREVLTRFYVLRHDPDKIRSEMDLTRTQFRLLKSRAKARFASAAAETLKTPKRVA